MNRLYLSLILPWLLYSFCANADSSMLEERSQGEVSFISGGIGGDERAALKTVRSDYNLSLLFSMQGSGEYFSDVSVRISDGKGRTVLDTVSEGPILLAKLKPGRYRVSVDHKAKRFVNRSRWTPNIARRCRLLGPVVKLRDMFVSAPTSLTVVAILALAIAAVKSSRLSPCLSSTRNP